MINEKDLIEDISKEADMNINGKMYMSVDKLSQITKDMPKLNPLCFGKSKFKRLEPGMIIHLETKEEHMALLTELYRLDWFFDEHKDSMSSHFLGEITDRLDKDRYIALERRSDGIKIIFSTYREDIKFYEKEYGMKLVEISDLIIYSDVEERKL